MTDDMILGDLAETVQVVQGEMRNRYKATEVRATVHGGEVDLRLEFRGFQTLTDALDRVSDVALDLDHNTAVSGVRAGVNSGGFDHPAETDAPDEDPDDRPAGWVTADLIHERDPEAVEEAEGVEKSAIDALDET